MRTGMFALVAGLLALRWLPALPGGTGWIVLLGVAVFASWRRWPGPALFAVGLAWACLNAQWALDERLDPTLDGRTLWLEGVVAELPERHAGVTRFVFQDAVSRRAQTLPGRMRLSWYGAQPLHAGERWRLAVTLRVPQGLRNPQAFDYQAWLLGQGIGASGTVKAGRRLAEGSGLARWRDDLQQRLAKVPAAGRQAVLTALVLGSGAGLTRDDWRLLQDTGTVHLMVISGQHIGLLAGVVYLLVAGLARCGCWPARLPWLPCACALALLMALGYGALAGFGVPVQRACLMLAAVLIWRLRFRRLPLSTALLAALALVLLGDPLASLQPGLWLSFGAVAVLALAFAGRLGVGPRWKVVLRAQLAVAVGLLPAMIALGLPVSLSAPLANLLAVPWVSLLLVPLSLLGTALLPLGAPGEWLLWLAGLTAEGLFVVLAYLASWAPAWIPADVPPWAVLLGLLGAGLLLLPAGAGLRWLGAPLLLPLLLPVGSRPAWGEAEVWMFDVGQGLSVLVRTREHALLYDAGPLLGDFDIGERVVLPSLRALGVARLDLLVLSHADNDHAGGAPGIQQRMPVARVLSGEAAALPISLGAQACRQGERWAWDGVELQSLFWEGGKEGNAASCVLRVRSAAGEALLLTGDIDVRAETGLIAQGAELRADWLVAPHHGSRTSSSAALLAATAAHTALVSRGRHNAFGHPHPEVLARYRGAGMQVLDTAERGALRVRLGARDEALSDTSRGHFWDRR